MNWKNKVIAITPFICLIVFAILWIEFDKAHPGWIVFLLIPLMPFILGKKKLSASTVIIIIYFLVSIITGKWNVTWVILLLIPVVNIIMLPSDGSKVFKFKKYTKKDDDFIDLDV